jgi:hypothetical protein
MLTSVNGTFDHGLLFSVKSRKSPISIATEILCHAIQRCKPMYTHVALLFNGVVYETSLVNGVEITLFDYVNVNNSPIQHVTFDVFLPLNELSTVNVADYEFALNELTYDAGRVCTTFVSDALYLANVNTPRYATPDQLYACLTQCDNSQTGTFSLTNR